MSTDRWTELEALAKAATPGPWDADRKVVFTPWTGWCDANGLPYDDRELVARAAEPDARYIAAANPHTVLDLIAHVRELEAMRAKVPELHVLSRFLLLHCAGCADDWPCATVRALGVTE